MERSHDNTISMTGIPRKPRINSGPNSSTVAGRSDLRKSDVNSSIVLVPPSKEEFANHHPYIRRVIDEINTTSKNKESHSNGFNLEEREKNADKQGENDLDYDPYEHYSQKHPTTYFGTMFHLLKASLGTGILAMPNAFRNAGWLFGTIGTLVVGCLCTHNMQILIQSEYKLCKRRKVPSMTYPDMMECAFEEGPHRLRWLAPHFRFLTNVFLVMYQIGISSVYYVFIANNFKQVYDTYAEGDINIRLMMVYLLVPFILICWVRNLKLLVPFSTVANVIGLLSFALIFVYIFEDLPSLNEREPIGSIYTIPLFFGTVLFAMEAVGAVFPLKNAMKEPRGFGGLFGVLNASIAPIALSYTIMGFFGYLKYGSTTQGSVTLNLPNEDLLPNAVKVLYPASTYITYALSNYIVFDIFWTNGIKIKVPHLPNKVLWEYVVRTSIAALTFLMAVAIPNLELFIAFTGSFCLSTIGIAFPAIAQTLAHWSERDNVLQFSLLVFKNFVIILIAIFAFIIGVGTTVLVYFEDER